MFRRQRISGLFKSEFCITLILCVICQPSVAGWTWSNPFPQGNSLSDVMWSERLELFIASGQGGGILTSADGVSWSVGNVGTTRSLNAVSEGAQLVAVGLNGAIYTSKQGGTWSVQSQITNQTLYDVTWSGSEFLAVGAGGTIIKSTDGIRWVAQDSGSTVTLRAVASRANEFVAVGDRGEILTSLDGQLWELRDAGVAGDLKDVVWSGQVWIAVGTDPELGSALVLRSIDGADWTKTILGPTGFSGVSWDGKQFVAVGSYEFSDAIFVSKDGLQWDDVTPRNPEQRLFSVAEGKGITVAVGEFGTILSSNEPSSSVSWLSRRTGFNDFLEDVIWAGDKYVAVGGRQFSGSIFTSPNGIHWERQQSSFYLFGAASALGQTVVVGSLGAILINSNGEKWISGQSSTDDDLYGVASNGVDFVAVGRLGAIMRSKDAVIWQESDSGIQDTLNDVAAISGLYVAVGTSGTILYSSDGVEWFQAESGIQDSLNGVVSNGQQQWIAVGNGGVILSSVNGTVWKSVVSGTTQDISDVYWDGQRYMAVGDFGTILSSTNGLTWHPEDSKTQNQLKGAASHGRGGQTVVVGYGGTVLRNPSNVPPSIEVNYPKNVDEQSSVELVGDASDVDGEVVRITWAQLRGPEVNFSTGNSSTLKFSTPEVTQATELVFQISATDDGGAVSDVDVHLLVNPINKQPSVSGGLPQTVESGATVNLLGSAFDTDGEIVSYKWTQLSGSAVSLSSDKVAEVMFVAPNVSSSEEFSFQLAVEDNEGGTALAEVVITVVPIVSGGIVNQAPVVNAGADQTVTEGSEVVLQASVADADGTVAAYSWEQIEGVPLIINGINSLTASFEAPEVERETLLVFRITVTDDVGDTASDEVKVVVQLANVVGGSSPEPSRPVGVSPSSGGGVLNFTVLLFLMFCLFRRTRVILER